LKGRRFGGDGGEFSGAQRFQGHAALKVLGWWSNRLTRYSLVGPENASLWRYVLLKPSSIVAFATLFLFAAAPAFANTKETGEVRKGDYAYVWRSMQVTAGPTKELEVSCPQGYLVVSGGYDAVMPNGYYGGVDVFESEPAANQDGWKVDAQGRRGSATVRVMAICAQSK
jgi:hypothetical protein